VAGAALDVYSQEPPPQALFKLIKHPKVVATPHIAASTDEAQQKVAVQVTEQVIQALQGEAVSTPVNGLAIRMAAQREVQPYLRLAEALGRIVGQLMQGSPQGVTVKCAGDVPRRFAEVLSVAALKGLLEPWANDPVNLINAPFLAEEMGIAVEEQRGSTTDNYTNLIEVALTTSEGTRSVGGTVFGTGSLRLVRVDDYRVEMPPEGQLLLYQNIDEPGMLATVGQLLAEANINIAALSLGRLTGRGSQALTLVSVDEPIPETVRARIADLEGVSGVHAITI
jgi:D-3-phosphoglycerate dehydrogenase